jgi:hypothetical protein
MKKYSHFVRMIKNNRCLVYSEVTSTQICIFFHYFSMQSDIREYPLRLTYLRFLRYNDPSHNVGNENGKHPRCECDKDDDQSQDGRIDCIHFTESSAYSADFLVRFRTINTLHLMAPFSSGENSRYIVLKFISENKIREDLIIAVSEQMFIPVPHHELQRSDRREEQHSGPDSPEVVETVRNIVQEKS